MPRMNTYLILTICLSGLLGLTSSNPAFVLSTWDYPEAVSEGWSQLVQGNTALDAIEKGINVCELTRCRGSVGYGNHPDESGETTLDALIMDGPTHDAGGVGCLRRVKKAISVARKVLENTKHTLLVGELATQFAEKMGFTIESLSTNESQRAFESWRNQSCQPNFWQNVSPDPTRNCGPYRPLANVSGSRIRKDRGNHDTIGMVAMDPQRKVASGTSTNGLTHKIPGRVGDSPIPGSGAYADQEVGVAAATGDGDIMMRFLPSYQAVESMRNGKSPQEAASDAIARITSKYPSFEGAVIVANLRGEFGIACHGWDNFPYTYANSTTGSNIKIETINCS